MELTSRKKRAAVPESSLSEIGRRLNIIRPIPNSPLLFSSLCCTLFLSGCLPKGNPSDPRVVLISIDGLRADIFLDPAANGFSEDDLPNLRRMAAEGAHIREVTTIFPSHTFPAHTSMVTGRLPFEHGITHNHPFDPERNFEPWYWWADSLKTFTVFHLAQEKGLITASTPWPVSVNGPFDYNVPEIEPVGDETTPTLDLVRRHDRPSMLIEYFALFSDLSSSEESTHGFQRDLNLHHIFKTVFKKTLPHLTGYHIIQTDDVQHAYGRRHEKVKEAFVFADSLVGSVMALITELNQWPTTTLIVTGDHGHVDHHTDVRLNALFEQERLLTIQNGSITTWDVVAHPAGGSAFIRLKYPTDATVREKVVSIFDDVPWGRLVEPSELPPALEGYGETDFVLLAEDGYNFPGELQHPFLFQHAGGGHGGDPRNPELKTTLFATGRGVKKGAVLDSSHTTQTAALIAKLLELPLASEAAPPQIFLAPEPIPQLTPPPTGRTVLLAVHQDQMLSSGQSSNEPTLTQPPQDSFKRHMKVLTLSAASN